MGATAIPTSKGDRLFVISFVRKLQVLPLVEGKLHSQSRISKSVLQPNHSMLPEIWEPLIFM